MHLTLSDGRYLEWVSEGAGIKKWIFASYTSRHPPCCCAGGKQWGIWRGWRQALVILRCIENLGYLEVQEVSSGYLELQEDKSEYVKL